jgi:hypothetical protein
MAPTFLHVPPSVVLRVLASKFVLCLKQLRLAKVVWPFRSVSGGARVVDSARNRLVTPAVGSIPAMAGSFFDPSDSNFEIKDTRANIFLLWLLRFVLAPRSACAPYASWGS